MVQKTAAFKTKGMNRDLSVSAFSSEFSFENRNLRLSTNDNNTMLSWVNEKGPAIIVDKDNKNIELKGTPIGTAVIDYQLVVFTTEGEGVKPDHIYALSYIDKDNTEGLRMNVNNIYDGNLNFNVKYPLETLVYYESPEIEKVYWTDGLNQPRLINIKASKEKTDMWNSGDGSTIDTWFDFVPAVGLKETLTVEKNVSGGGLFMPGVIQYCFTYLNKYGQQSNIVAVSPLYYLAHDDRGGKPDEHISNSFTITIDNVDTSFDYVRLYSIQRTEVDTTAEVRLIEDLSIKGGKKEEDGSVSISYTDNGTAGSSADPMELLYVGGKEITAYTMAMKDNTLFLGNIAEKNILMDKIQDYFDVIRNDSTKETVQFSNSTEEGGKPFTLKKMLMDPLEGTTYSHTNTLKWNQRQITTFKGGETYRMGLQFQKNTGEWLEPIWIDDVKNNYYPHTYINKNEVDLTYAFYHMNWKKIAEEVNGENLDTSKLIRVRPVVVYPSIEDRDILCQGVLNPTVFNIEDRVTNSPFSQASWFFRPYMWNTANGRSKTPTISKLDDDSIKEATNGSTVITPSTGGDKPNCDPDEYFKDMVDKCYILVARVEPGALKDILRRKYLVRHARYKDSEDNLQDEDISESFYGAIELQSQDGDNIRQPLYAFVRKTKYWAEDNTKSGGSSEQALKYLDLTDVAVTHTTFYMYTGMHVQNGLLYYLQPEGSGEEAETYTLKFYTEGADYGDESPTQDNYTYYEVKFKSVGEDMVNVIDTGMEEGSSDVRFTHYDSLYTLETCEEDYRRLEIQGSHKEYDSPFNEKKKDPTSNNQFFVDQSIVTLNSPDVEFDTMVQNYAKDNLKLRIVGAIPLTANISSHYITSTAMLEQGHNVEDPSSLMRQFGLTEWYRQVTGWTDHKGFGVGEKKDNVVYKNVSLNAGRRLVANYLWNDIIVKEAPKEEDKVQTGSLLVDYLVYPWQQTGSLNNDRRKDSEASSVLQTKVEATMSYSVTSKYFDLDHINEYIDSTELNEETDTSDANLRDKYMSFAKIEAVAPLTENAEVMNYRLDKQSENTSCVNYYANIDKVLMNTNGYRTYVSPISKSIDEAVNEKSQQKEDAENYLRSNPVRMKYKSTTHYAIALDSTEDTSVPILPYGEMTIANKNSTTGKWRGLSGLTFWGDNDVSFKQHGLKLDDLFADTNDDGDTKNASQPYSYLWLGELYKEVGQKFGGNTKNAIMANKWLPAGEVIDLRDTEGAFKEDIPIYWTTGDTYYQRYDCLKTYPYTTDDQNQLIEILSFMCETHVNIDGRYDMNRGQVNNTYVNPVNFNLINTAYSQKDNFFQYNKMDEDALKVSEYPNQAYYSKTKTSGADVDLFTNVTLGSTMEFDGDKGKLNAIRRLNNNLWAFQDTGISQILYNEQVQVSTENGIPIEIANSGKVQGTRYISDTIGCSNKWAMASTPSGIYFMDNVDKSIYMLGGNGLQNITLSNGMNTWAKQNIPSSKALWNPEDFENFTAYYDSQNQDVLFIDKDMALAYSEKTGTFTSFYDYGNTPYFNNLEGTGIWLRKNEGTTNVYRHNAGEYCDFFGDRKPYWMTLIGNPEPQVSKIFTNLEFRASVDGDTKTTDEKTKFLLPFDYIEAWDEYQHGTTKLSEREGNGRFQHHIKWNADTEDISNISRKFRIWRCDIPRDNASVPDSLGLPRIKPRYMDRMRNPWIYMKLMKNADESMNRTEVHDVLLKYFE